MPLTSIQPWSKVTRRHTTTTNNSLINLKLKRIIYERSSSSEVERWCLIYSFHFQPEVNFSKYHASLDHNSSSTQRYLDRSKRNRICVEDPPRNHHRAHRRSAASLPEPLKQRQISVSKCSSMMFSTHLERPKAYRRRRQLGSVKDVSIILERLRKCLNGTSGWRGEILSSSDVWPG